VSCQGGLKFSQVKQRGVISHGNSVVINPFRDFGRSEDNTIKALQHVASTGFSEAIDVRHEVVLGSPVIFPEFMEMDTRHDIELSF
jgi:hypothetical protein